MSNPVINLPASALDFDSNEAINMLRGNIEMAGYHYKVVSFTSAVPNEGKSYISFNLAQSMAALGKRTVFVDCDIRNSYIKKVNGITDKTVGLSEYLCGLCPAEEAIYPTSVADFDMVLAGKRAPNPSELLSGEMFDRLLDYLKEKYDYIILDTPPVNVVVDATVVSKRADTTVLVVKSCSTERVEAMHMKKQLEAAGIRILGVVINLYDTQKSHYGKYGYGKYGYGKYGYGKYGHGKYGYGEYGYGEYGGQHKDNVDDTKPKHWWTGPKTAKKDGKDTHEK